MKIEEIYSFAIIPLFICLFFFFQIMDYIGISFSPPLYYRIKCFSYGWEECLRGNEWNEHFLIVIIFLSIKLLNRGIDEIFVYKSLSIHSIHFPPLKRTINPFVKCFARA
jgi:hypothetical protein